MNIPDDIIGVINSYLVTCYNCNNKSIFYKENHCFHCKKNYCKKCLKKYNNLGPSSKLLFRRYYEASILLCYQCNFYFRNLE